MVFLMLVNANHDRNYFQDPLRVGFVPRTNRHLSFGRGAHMCPGAHIAKVETKVALRELCKRLEGYDYSVAEAWKPSWIMKGPESAVIRSRAANKHTLA